MLKPKPPALEFRAQRSSLWWLHWRGPAGASARPGLEPINLESRIKVLGLQRPHETSPTIRHVGAAPIYRAFPLSPSPRALS